MPAKKNYINSIYGKFKIIEDLGLQKYEGKKPWQYAIGKCLNCNKESKALMSNFTKLRKKCVCEHIDRSKIKYKVKPIKMDTKNFFVIEDLGTIRPSKNSPGKIRYVNIQCKNCNHQMKCTYSNFIGGIKKCICELPKKSPINWNRIYRIHYQMISRCYDNEDKDFKYYGAKGIKVCDEWRSSRKPFYSWAMDNGYNKELTLDRIDYNGHYSPENCRWTTRTIQQRNRSNSVGYDKVIAIKRLIKDGHARKEIAFVLDIPYSTVCSIGNGRSWKDVE